MSLYSGEACYYFLRRVEHRLQMINDEQTPTLPQDEDALSHLAIFLGYKDINSFTRALLARLKIVEALFIELFEISLIPVTGLAVRVWTAHLELAW